VIDPPNISFPKKVIPMDSPKGDAPEETTALGQVSEQSIDVGVEQTNTIDHLVGDPSKE
jgi:hypothetical protein